MSLSTTHRIQVGLTGKSPVWKAITMLDDVSYLGEFESCHG